MTPVPVPENEALWRTIFQDGHPELAKQHWLHRALPRDPRCRLCLAPFGGPGGWVMRRRGKTPSGRNPNYCTACDGFLNAYPGGAEVTMSAIFADLRGSTARSASIPAHEFAREVGAFFAAATQVLAEEDGFVVEFRGDCVAAVFPPGFTGPDHAQKAAAAARRLAALPQTPPFGVGVHVGPMYIGAVPGATGRVEAVTVFGAEVNLTARLAATAGPGEALASGALIAEAGAKADTMRTLSLAGFDQPVAAGALRG